MEKEFHCECGKSFTVAQSFNGHKCHCKEHIIAKNGEIGYQEYLKQQRLKAELVQKARKQKSEIQAKNKLNTWLASNPICQRCGKLMTEKFGSGKFCSRACANKKIHSELTRQKISSSVKKSVAKKQTSHSKKFCILCRQKLKNNNKTGFCKYCLDNTEEGRQVKQELGKKGYQTMLKHGTHKPWQSRNITSYAEEFWIAVLQNNNIQFLREVPVKHNNSNYFLDFKIEKNGKLIDLEVDGKQHTYADRAASDITRDTFLTKQGYFIYRVPWNEVVSEQGKLEMKTKIDEFLAFYSTL